MIRRVIRYSTAVHRKCKVNSCKIADTHAAAVSRIIARDLAFVQNKRALHIHAAAVFLRNCVAGYRTAVHLECTVAAHIHAAAHPRSRVVRYRAAFHCERTAHKNSAAVIICSRVARYSAARQSENAVFFHKHAAAPTRRVACDRAAVYRKRAAIHIHAAAVIASRVARYNAVFQRKLTI